MRALAILGLGILAACAAPRPAPGIKNWEAMSVDDRRQALRDATSKCGLPASHLTLVGGLGVELKPDADDDYRKIDCLLAELNMMKGMKLGFIGNEAIVENRQ